MAKMANRMQPLQNPANSTDMNVQTLQLGDMKNLVYLIEDAVTRRIAVIDPAWDVQAILIAAGNAVISDILVSHWHDDHTNGINELVAATGAKVHLLQQEADFWNVKEDTPACLHTDGNTVQLGSLNIQLLHTPDIHRVRPVFTRVIRCLPVTPCLSTAAAAVIYPVAMPGPCITACNAWSPPWRTAPPCTRDTTMPISVCRTWLNRNSSIHFYTTTTQTRSLPFVTNTTTTVIRPTDQSDGANRPGRNRQYVCQIKMPTAYGQEEIYDSLRHVIR